MDPKPGVLASAPKNPAPNNLPGLPPLPTIGTLPGAPATGGRPAKIKPVFLAYNPDSGVSNFDWVSKNINPQTLKDVHQRLMKAPSSLPEGLSPQAAKYTNNVTKLGFNMRGRAISKGAMPSVAKKLR
jgi:hypothetical protein